MRRTGRMWLIRGATVCTAAAVCLLAVWAWAKYRGPDVARLARTADLVAVVYVKAIDPNPDARASGNYSRVTAKVLETLKGYAPPGTIRIETRKRMEEGDYLAHARDRKCLLFLVQKGSLYHAAYGRSGVFEMEGGKVLGWPKSGDASYPKPDRSVDYGQVRAEIAGLLRAKCSATDEAVFSAVLDARFPNPRKMLVVDRQTSAIPHTEADTVGGTAERRRELLPLVDALNRLKGRSGVISGLNTSYRVTLAEHAEIERVLANGSWTEFYKRFAGAGGLVSFSLPAYSKGGDSAILYYDVSSGGLADWRARATWCC